MPSLRKRLAEVDAELAKLGSAHEEASGIRAKYVHEGESDELIAALSRDVEEFKKRLAAVDYPSRQAIADLASVARISDLQTRRSNRPHAEEDFEMLADDDILEIVDEDPGDDLELAKSVRPGRDQEKPADEAEPIGLFKRIFRGGNTPKK